MFFLSSMKEDNLLPKLWHTIYENFGRKVILPHQLTILTFHFFQVCLSAKMQNETDLIFPPIYLKVMWFYAINPIPVAHFLAKTCNNTQWGRINSEKEFLFMHLQFHEIFISSNFILSKKKCYRNILSKKP